MKKIKRPLLFGIPFLVLGGCVDSPDFDHSPKISFEDIYFVKSTGPGVKESLVISVNFKDGDGDLGLAPNKIDSGFHAINFLANDNGELLPVSSVLIPDFTGYTYKNTGKTPKNPSYLVQTPSKIVGELITLDSRNERFSLPPFEKPYDCAANLESYLNEGLSPDTVFIFKSDEYLIKNKATIVDILENNQNKNVYYYAVRDYFYIHVNPAHTNIKVQFMIKNGDGSFAEYDWRKETCETYDGRFPILTERSRSLEGTINYAMISSGFSATFGIKRLKLVITINDNALHASNTVESREFTLEEITR